MPSRRSDILIPTLAYRDLLRNRCLRGGSEAALQVLLEGRQDLPRICLLSLHFVRLVAHDAWSSLTQIRNNEERTSLQKHLQNRIMRNATLMPSRLAVSLTRERDGARELESLVGLKSLYDSFSYQPRCSPLDARI